MRTAAGVLVTVLLLTACGQQPDRLSNGEPGVAAAAQPCPEALRQGDPDVPAPPTPLLSGALVPEEVPRAVSVCRYADLQDGGDAALEGERELSGGLAALPGDLAVPAGTDAGVCTAMGGPLVPYLVQLRYADQVVWLRTHDEVNGCAIVTNGAFTSGTYLGGQVAASYEAGAWVEAPSRRVGVPASDCPEDPSGRAGQEQELVPGGWSEVVVCRSTQQSSAAALLSDDEATGVVALLNRLPTTRAQGYSSGCDGRQDVAGLDDSVQLAVHILYPGGRAVVVVPFVGCDPPLSNGSLAGQATVAEQEALLRLLG